MKLDLVSSLAANRRSFLKGAGVTGLGLATAAMIGSKFGPDMQNVKAASIDDGDILNFALNLEYLEAEFYCMSTLGKTLVQLEVIDEGDTTGPTTGGAFVKGLYQSSVGDLSGALRIHEENHVKFLRSALGSSAVKKPAINLDALGYGYTSVASWLELARQFEDVGVSAYLGAAPLISSKAYLAAAGAILSVEAFHSGAIRMACIQTGTASPAVDSQDIPPTSANFFDASSGSLAISRTPAEVLNIVYGGGTSSGGFYPDGMNGTITSQS